MPTQEKLAEDFEEHRDHLRSVAYRMLGSMTEADDAVQEGWLRLARTDTSDVVNLRGWLTTVVSRVCLDHLRSRKSRREESARLPLPRPGRDPARRRPGGFGGAVRRGDVGAARGARRPQPARADGVRPARHVRRAVRPDRRDRGRYPGDRDAARQPGAPPGPLDPTPDGRPVHPAPRPGGVHLGRPGGRLRGAPGGPGSRRGSARRRRRAGLGHRRGAAEVASQASAFRRSGHEPEQTWVLVNGAVGLLSLREGRPIAVFCPVSAASRIVEINILTDPDRIAAPRPQHGAVTRVVRTPPAAAERPRSGRRPR